MIMMYNKFLIERVATGHWTLACIGSSFGHTAIQHKLVQFPVILDSYPSNNIIIIMIKPAGII